jgi:hypothetical protein
MAPKCWCSCSSRIFNFGILSKAYESSSSPKAIGLSPMIGAGTAVRRKSPMAMTSTIAVVVVGNCAATTETAPTPASTGRFRNAARVPEELLEGAEARLVGTS